MMTTNLETESAVKPVRVHIAIQDNRLIIVFPRNIDADHDAMYEKLIRLMREEQLPISVVA